MKSLRALQIAVEVAASKARPCSVESCSRSTREGKDYCTYHVELHPYVRNLLEKIKVREEEDTLVQRKGAHAVNMDGLTVNEILLYLKNRGARTEERLSRDLQLEKVIIHNYLIRLSMEGLVKFGRTQRNHISVSLIDHDPSLVIKEDD